MTFAPETTGELIHDAAHNTGITVLDALAQGRDVDTTHFKTEERLECQCRRHLQCGGRTKPCT